jgi:maltose alpha-D-glucosyltransferase/alpha-amylase
MASANKAPPGSRAQLVLDLLRRQRPRLPERARGDAERILGAAAEVDHRLRAILQRKLTGLRVRCHGDYHLGQVLSTGRDFVILDFEGEPERSLTERRLKRSPLRDAAGMLRSYHYAAYTALFEQHARGLGLPNAEDTLEPWARFWYTWVTATFLRAYLAAASSAKILPASDAEVEMLLGFYMLEKALYELRYELNNRPDWAIVPLRGILQIIEMPAAEG